MTDSNSELLRPAEVSREYRVSEQTLSNWRWSRRGPRFLKAGGRVLYRRSDVERWLDDNATDPAA